MKTIALILFIPISANLFGQLGLDAINTDYDLLYGKRIKFNNKVAQTIVPTLGIQDFYTKQPFEKQNIYRKTSGYGFGTDFEEIKNDTFICISSGLPKKQTLGEKTYYLALKNISKKDTIFFKLNSAFWSKDYDLIDTIIPPKEYYCKNIITDDKGKRSADFQDMQVTKQGTKTYLMLYEKIELAGHMTGIKIKSKKSVLINRPTEKSSVSVTADGFRHLFMISLTPEEIKKLKSNFVDEITTEGLYLYVNKYELNDYINCMTK